MRDYFDDLIRGIWRENTTFRLLIGMCPALAVTTLAINGLIMGIAVTAVVMCSSVMISSLKSLIPKQVRIPVFIVIIATFVTMADLLLAALVPEVHKVLGLFVPLIVVNCLILGRAEAFASRGALPAASPVNTVTSTSTTTAPKYLRKSIIPCVGGLRLQTSDL